MLASATKSRGQWAAMHIGGNSSDGCFNGRQQQQLSSGSNQLPATGGVAPSRGDAGQVATAAATSPGLLGFFARCETVLEEMKMVCIVMCFLL